MVTRIELFGTECVDSSARQHLLPARPFEFSQSKGFADLPGLNCDTGTACMASYPSNMDGPEGFWRCGWYVRRQSRSTRPQKGVRMATNIVSRAMLPRGTGMVFTDEKAMNSASLLIFLVKGLLYCCLIWVQVHWNWGGRCLEIRQVALIRVRIHR